VVDDYDVTSSVTCTLLNKTLYRTTNYEETLLYVGDESEGMNVCTSVQVNV